MRESQGSTTSRDGTRIGWTRTGEGSPLVLVHGTTADRLRWSPLVPELSSRFTVIAVDRRGRGLSEAGGDYHVEREFEDVASVVTTINDELGAVHLLGHSYGALCSLEAALRVDASALASLILYEPPMPEDGAPTDVLERIDAALDAGDPDRALREFFAEIALLPDETIDLLAAAPSWQRRMENAHTLHRELQLTYTIEPDRVASISAPTLFLIGGESPAEITEPIDRLAEALPNATTVVLEGQHHNAMDTAPDLFLRTVLSWLDPRRSGTPIAPP